MKEHYYPNYVNEYHLRGNVIVIKRRCSDGETRYINTIYFDTPEECEKYFENEL